MSRKAVSNLLAVLGLVIAVTISFGSNIVYGQAMTVSIKKLRSGEGVVHVLVYDNAKAFAENSITDLVTYSTQPVSGDPMMVTLNGVKPGKYAIVLHHDENGNNQLEMDGDLPLEGWGYSNNVGKNNTPDFASAAFDFSDDKLSQSIKMRYAN